MRNLLLILSCSAIVVAVLGIWYVPDGDDQACRFTALDVGQGDALLIQTPDRQDILIDGGPNRRVLDALNRHMGIGNDDIEFVILTHPDADHLAGLLPVLESFRVRTILSNGAVTDTSTYRRWQQALLTEGADIRVGMAGQAYTVGTSLSFKLLWPGSGIAGQENTMAPTNGVGGTNDDGIVMNMTCAGSRVLLTGDISHDVEQRLVDAGADVAAPLLKVAHHGSRYSSDPDFLAAVGATMAIISNGKDNRYGHPHPLAMQRLEKAGMRVFRTDSSGDVQFRSDGRGGWVPAQSSP